MSSIPTTPRKKGIPFRFLIGFVLIALAIGLFVARGAKKSMVYYVTVSELLAQPRNSEGLRVTGTVVPGTIQRDDLVLRFEMTDGTKALPVEYKGIVPDTFGEKGEVVVEGAYHAGGSFEANFLMAKCPSKYEMSPDEEMPANMPRSGKTS
ncbi:MAG: cytochrome c maturation protein CcmE [Candidatus Eisenbacteria bacterium]|nr:cytochrome c maturation protein CcmE [Candidatus Eisenbacteria bacterium]